MRVTMGGAGSHSSSGKGRDGDGGKGRTVKEVRTRKVHVLLGLLALAVVAGVGTLIAKKGFPDIDPVKVSAREGERVLCDTHSPNVHQMFRSSQPHQNVPIIFQSRSGGVNPDLARHTPSTTLMTRGPVGCDALRGRKRACASATCTSWSGDRGR